MQIQAHIKPSENILTTMRRDNLAPDKQVHPNNDKSICAKDLALTSSTSAGTALASMCRFLSGFASYGSACAGALVVLETPQIVRSLERRYSLQRLNCQSNYPSSNFPDDEVNATPDYLRNQVRVSVQHLLEVIASKSMEANKECSIPSLKRTCGQACNVAISESVLQGTIKQNSILSNIPEKEDIPSRLGLKSDYTISRGGTERVLEDDCSIPLLNTTSQTHNLTSSPGALCRCGMIHTLRRSRKRPLHPLAHSPKFERLCSAPPSYLERVVSGGIGPGVNSANAMTDAYNASTQRVVEYTRSPNESFPNCCATFRECDIKSANNSSRAFVRETKVNAREPSNSPHMHAVYVGKSAAGRGLQSRLATPIPYTVPEGGFGHPFRHTLIFDASFESANLLSAVQRGPNEYDLFLRADLHTEGFTQWFYFAVTNTHSMEQVEIWRKQGDYFSDYSTMTSDAALITFNIVNLTKPDSLFKLGMQPVMYSCAEAAEHGIGWVRTGTGVQYHGNLYPRHPVVGNTTVVDGGVTYYTLSFTLAFARPDDIYLVAHSYPYTYSDHKAHLAAFLHSTRKRRITRHTILCRTLDGNDCDLLTITSDENDSRGGAESDTPAMPYLTRRKKVIVLSARVHPGETPASWMMRGILDFLTGEIHDARILRSLFVFKIVPMLNPDGVIYGNNRCSLAGVDLNR